MKTIGLLALLVTLAAPAWAFNEDLWTTQKAWEARKELCARSDGGSYDGVCAIKTAPSEAAAVEHATNALRRYCPWPADAFGPDLCDETRAYIKQRWGY